MISGKAASKLYDRVKALGEISINSEYTMVFHDHPDVFLLIKQFPIPITSPEDKIEVPLIGGIKGHTAQVPRIDYSGTIVMYETVDGKTRAFLEKLALGRTISNRPKFNATLYHGVPEDHAQKWEIKDALIHGIDPIDTDTENRGTLTTISGQISYIYFPGFE